MTEGPEPRERPEREDDEVWAGIVAAYHASPDASTVASPDALRSIEPDDDPSTPPARSTAAAPGPRSWAPAEHVEEHYVPPPPAPAPPLEPAARAAWFGVIGGPVALLLIALVGWDAPDLVVWGLAMGFLAGFVTLVARMRSGRGTDGGSVDGDGDGDDGAVV